MGIFDFLKKQLITIIEWKEGEQGALAYHYPSHNREIQNGAQLIVTDTQVVLFIDQGKIADIFEAGMHTLETNNMPVLSHLQSWDKVLKSSFKSDIFFFSLTEQIDQRWGTPTPIILKDNELGLIKVRAHGIYSYKIKNPKVFFTKVSGTKDAYTTQELANQLRSGILTNFTTFLGKGNHLFTKIAANQSEYSQILKDELQGIFSYYGLSLETFYIQSISLTQDTEDRVIPTSQENNTMATISQLHEMMKKGILTQKEFEDKKSELLKKVGV